MKHMAKIYFEYLVKVAKWDSLSRDTQLEYLRLHPQSDKVVTAPITTGVQLGSVTETVSRFVKGLINQANESILSKKQMQKTLFKVKYYPRYNVMIVKTKTDSDSGSLSSLVYVDGKRKVCVLATGCSNYEPSKQRKVIKFDSLLKLLLQVEDDLPDMYKASESVVSEEAFVK